MSTWRWIREDVVLAVHDRQLAEHGGAEGIIDPGGLASAMARPQHRANYERPDVADLAAAYLIGIVRNHPFADGNKRTAWVVARLFISLNGFTLEFDPIDAVRIVEHAAGGGFTDESMADWFRKHLARKRPASATQE